MHWPKLEVTELGVCLSKAGTQSKRCLKDQAGNSFCQFKLSSHPNRKGIEPNNFGHGTLWGSLRSTSSPLSWRGWASPFLSCCFILACPLTMMGPGSPGLQLSGWFPWLVWCSRPGCGWPFGWGSQDPVATLPRRPRMQPWFWCLESRVLASQLPQPLRRNCEGKRFWLTVLLSSSVPIFLLQWVDPWLVPVGFVRAVHGQKWWPPTGVFRYSAIAPLILPACAAYFAMASVVYRRVAKHLDANCSVMAPMSWHMSNRNPLLQLLKFHCLQSCLIWGWLFLYAAWWAIRMSFVNISRVYTIYYITYTHVRHTIYIYMYIFTYIEVYICAYILYANI